jgi:hypothetical protein
MRTDDHDISRRRGQHCDTKHVSNRVNPRKKSAIANLASETIAGRFIDRRCRKPAYATVAG